MYQEYYFFTCAKLHILAQSSVPSVSPSPSIPGTTMIDILRDSAWWQAPTVFISIIALFLAWRQYQRKSFSYSVISTVNILDISDDIKSKISVSFESKVIQNLYSVVIRFTNSGNTPILKNDYDHPVSISLGKMSEILSVEVLNQSPGDLGIKVDHSVQQHPNTSSSSSISQVSSEEIIVIEPALLNKRDSFDLKILATEFEYISVNARIVGVAKILKKVDVFDDKAKVELNVIVWIVTVFTTIIITTIPYIFLGVTKHDDIIKKIEYQKK